MVARERRNPPSAEAGTDDEDKHDHRHDREPVTQEPANDTPPLRHVGHLDHELRRLDHVRRILGSSPAYTTSAIRLAAMMALEVTTIQARSTGASPDRNDETNRRPMPEIEKI